MPDELSDISQDEDEARIELERVVAEHPGTTPARLAGELLAP